MRRKMDYRDHMETFKLYKVETDKGTFKGYYQESLSDQGNVCLVDTDGTGRHDIPCEDITKVFEVEN